MIPMLSSNNQICEEINSLYDEIILNNIKRGKAFQLIKLLLKNYFVTVTNNFIIVGISDLLLYLT